MASFGVFRLYVIGILIFIPILFSSVYIIAVFIEFSNIQIDLSNMIDQTGFTRRRKGACILYIILKSRRITVRSHSEIQRNGVTSQNQNFLRSGNVCSARPSTVCTYFSQKWKPSKPVFIISYLTSQRHFSINFIYF